MNFVITRENTKNYKELESSWVRVIIIIDKLKSHKVKKRNRGMENRTTRKQLIKQSIQIQAYV